MRDAGLTIDPIFDEYQDVDRQSILSLMMKVIADEFYCL